MATEIHTMHLGKRSSDDCRTHVNRRRATTAEKHSSGYPSEWRSYTARTDNLREVSLETLGHKASPGEWCSLGGTSVPHMRQCRHGSPRPQISAHSKKHITRGDRRSRNMWDSIDSLCHDASTTESTRSFS